MICIQIDSKLEWLLLTYGHMGWYTFSMWKIWQDKIGKIMNNMIRVVFKRVRERQCETEKIQGWSIVVSISDMDQSWNQLNTGKRFHTLKTNFQYFSNLVIRLHRFLTCVMFYTEYISQYSSPIFSIATSFHNKYELYPIYFLLLLANFI